jgi:hypothetical protein
MYRQCRDEHFLSKGTSVDKLIPTEGDSFLLFERFWIWVNLWSNWVGSLLCTVPKGANWMGKTGQISWD